MNISNDDNVTLPKEFGYADVTMGDQSDDPKSKSRKRKKTDDNVTLPETISKLFLINIL